MGAVAVASSLLTVQLRGVRPLILKSNLAYELYQSQCLQPEGLLRHSTFGQHPYVSAGKERFEYKTAGEISFLEHKRKQRMR